MRILILLVLLSMVTVQEANAHHEWRTVTASAYGTPSRWDSFMYYGSTNSWWSSCAIRDAEGEMPTHDWAYFRLSSEGIAHQWLPLGSWVELRVRNVDGQVRYITAPVVDRGPFAGWGDDGGPDIQEPLVRVLGYTQASHWGLQVIQMRQRPDLGRFCPRYEIRLPDMLAVQLHEGGDLNLVETAIFDERSETLYSKEVSSEAP